MDIRYANHPDDSRFYTTDELRSNYLQEQIFATDKIALTYTHVDRLIFGGAMPVEQDLALTVGEELKAEYFLQRREMGIINIGGDGSILIDGTEYDMKSKDGIYIGMGNKDIIFKSKDSKKPAKFYINSAPAHAAYPIVKMDIASANAVSAGDNSTINKRVLYQYVHPKVCKSCQLLMGMTILEPGNCWNTMPCHTHERRMEVYLYFNLQEDAVVFHIMGEPNETRHIVMRNEQAVISPSWSVHTGVGTTNYTFIWGMCGENQEFTDMDAVKTNEML